MSRTLTDLVAGINPTLWTRRCIHPHDHHRNLGPVHLPGIHLKLLKITPGITRSRRSGCKATWERN